MYFSFQIWHPHNIYANQVANALSKYMPISGWWGCCLWQCELDSIEKLAYNLIQTFIDFKSKAYAYVTGALKKLSDAIAKSEYALHDWYNVPI